MALRRNPNEKFDLLRKQAADARAHQDREVWLNIAFYLGEQYVSWATMEDGTGRILPPDRQDKVPVERRLPRPVINKIMHFAQQELAFAMQARPVADVMPAGDSYLDQGDADVANAYIRWLQEPNVGNWEGVLWDAQLWALVANEAFIKWVYDPAEDRPHFQFVPSTDLYSDPYVRNFYKARWVIHSQFLDPEQVFDVWGKEIPTTAVEVADHARAEMLREMGQAPVQKGSTVNELWYKPCRRYPKGLYRVWSGREVLVETDDFPYDHGEIPFTIIGTIPRPNSKHYASPVSFLRAPQAELNKYHAQRIMTREAWALLKLVVEETTELQTPWDNSPNQVVRYSGPNPPAIIGPPGTMPDNNDGDWLAQEMQNVVGLHEVSQGQVPGRVEAAKAIELLRESDTSRLAMLNATVSTAISKGWYQTLMLARQYKEGDTMVEAYGKEGVPEVKRFTTDQFKPGMRIRVSQGTGLAYSRAARLDQLLALRQQGLLNDPEDFAKLADIPIPNMLSVKRYDVKLARNENLKIAEGQAVQANSWDDHTIHLREHNNYRKTAEFATLDEDEKQKFEFHCSQHEDMELEKLKKDAEKMRLMMEAQGQAPPGPPPGDPNAGGGAPGSQAISAEGEMVVE